MSRENNTCTPHLRFPGFTGEWQEKKLGEIIKLSKGSQINGSELNKTSGYPMMNGGSTLSGYYTDYNNEADTIIISEGGNSCGFVNYMTERFWAGGHCYVVSLLHDDVKEFVYQLLKAHESKIQALRVGSGLPNIQSKDLLNYEVLFCSDPTEQKKIAECLAEIDKLIAAQGENVDALKEEKKGLMQQLFPLKGETTPRLRFQGFLGDWEVKKLSECFDLLPNSTLARSDLNNISGKALYVHYGDILVKYDAMLDLNKEQLPYITNDALAEKACKATLKDGDIILADTAEDEVVGKCSEILNIGGTPVVAGLHTIPLRPTIRFANGYMGYYLNSFSYREGLYKLMQGVKVTGISRSAIQNTIIKIPPTISEQKRIAECLSALEDQITAESEKLEALIDHKKGLMQQLFPQPAK